MKKTLALAMATMMTLSLAACGSVTTSSSTAASSDTESASTSSTTTNEAAAGAEINLKIGVSTAETDPRNIAAQSFADEITEKSGGTITATVYPSGQLGGDADLINSMALDSGTVDIIITDASNFATYEPKMGISALPFLFDDFDDAWEFMDGPIEAAAEEGLIAQNMRVLAHYDNGFRCVTNSKGPVEEPADMKGMLIRTPENPVIMATMTALIPSTLTVFIVSLLSLAFRQVTGMYLMDAIYKLIQAPLEGLAQQSWIAVILIVVIPNLLWFLGIHGAMVMNPLLTPLYVSALAANIDAINAGQPATNILTTGFLGGFLGMGGNGITISLIVAILLFSKRADQKEVAKLGLIPSIFGISEPVMFGLPIVLNPIYLIPFILAPTISFFGQQLLFPDLHDNGANAVIEFCLIALYNGHREKNCRFRKGGAPWKPKNMRC